MSIRPRQLLWPGLMAATMLAVLLGLGTWQVERLHWKLGILAQIARAEAAPAVQLPANPEPYTKVQATGRLRDDLSASYGAEVRDTSEHPSRRPTERAKASSVVSSSRPTTAASVTARWMGPNGDGTTAVIGNGTGSTYRS